MRERCTTSSTLRAPATGTRRSPGTQRTIWLWEVDRGEFLHVVGRFEQAVNDAAYASLGNALVAVSEDGTLFFTTMPSWTEKRRLSFDEELLAVAYAPSRR